MVKMSFNKFHGKWEIYYHKNGKHHIGYAGSMFIAGRMRTAAQRVLDQL